MATIRNRIIPRSETIIAELRYWRGIRLDCPWRKTEALYNIDQLLDEMLDNGKQRT